MRSFIIVIALLLSTANTFAADKDKENKTPETLETGSVQKSLKRESTTRTQLSWPRPYKSTEEIRVDSTVPFPTDI